MTATLTAPVVETVECKRGTVTLTTTADGWSIRGVSKTHPARVYDLELVKCDCRTNPESKNLKMAGASKFYPDSNLGMRPLCPKRPEHNKDCHKKLDHCRARAHDGFDIRALFDDVCKSYNAPLMKPDTARQSILTDLAPSHRIVLTKGELTELESCRVS